MKSLRTLLILLLAWTFSVQAVAGASGVNCRHAGGQTATVAAEAAPVGCAAVSDAVDPHAMHRGSGHAGQAKAETTTDAQKVSADSGLGCGCGCHCADQHCSSPPSGPTGRPGTALSACAAVSLRPVPEPASSASAYARDLIRPPSIS